MERFFPKKRDSEILVREKNVRPPKLGVRSPPLLIYYPTTQRIALLATVLDLHVDSRPNTAQATSEMWKRWPL